MMNLIANSQKIKGECNLQIHIRLAEPFWRSVGIRNLSLKIADGSRVSDLLALLRKDYPALSVELDQSPPHIFIEDMEADAASFLTEGGHLHIVWPVAGG
jgi:hypothetical protein